MVLKDVLTGSKNKFFAFRVEDCDDDLILIHIREQGNNTHEYTFEVHGNNLTGPLHYVKTS